MRAMVTGASGFLGRHLVEVLVAHGHQVRAYLRPSSKSEPIDACSPELVRGELHDAPALLRACDGCDAVFHAAGRLRFWDRHPERLMPVNVEGTRAVLAAVRAAGCGRLVHVSDECTVGREPDDRPATESTPFNLYYLRDTYILSKVRAEQLVQEEVRRGLDAVVVNPGLCFGAPDGRPSPGGALVLRFLAGRLRWRLSGGFFAASVGDVALGALRAWERGSPGQRYLLGTRDLSYAELLQLLGRSSGLAAPQRCLPFRLAQLAAQLAEAWVQTELGDPPAVSRSLLCRMATRKGTEPRATEQALGLCPTPLATAVERAVRWHKERR